MKQYFKVYGLGLMTALALAGCSNEEMSEATQSSALTNQSKAISFSPYTPKTRTAITNSNITNYKFAVVGYNGTTGAAYLSSSGTQAFGTYGTMMEYKGEATGTWGNVYSDEAKEWPTDGTTLNFIACAPIPKDATEGITPIVIKNEDGSVKYSHGSGAQFLATAGNSVNALTIDSWIPPYTDVMYATATNVTSPDARPAELNFKHALLQLGSFNAKLLQNGYRIELAQVEILNVYTQGTITIPLIANPTIQYSNKMNLPGTDLTQKLTNAKPINWTSNDVCADDGSNGVSLFKDLNSFIIPPTKDELWYYSGDDQDGSRPAVGSTRLALRLWVRVYKSDGTVIFPLDTTPTDQKEELEMGESKTKTLYGITWVPCVNESGLRDLEAGHRYTFNLNFKYTFGYTPGTASTGAPDNDPNAASGASHVDPKPHYFDNNIKFSVGVAEWKDDVINITI